MNDSWNFHRLSSLSYRLKGALEGESYYGKRTYNLICIPSGACSFGICVLAASSSCFLAFCDSSSSSVDLNKINKSDFHIALYLISTLYLGYSVSWAFWLTLLILVVVLVPTLAAVSLLPWSCDKLQTEFFLTEEIGPWERGWLNTFTTLVIPWVVCWETYLFFSLWMKWRLRAFKRWNIS